MVGKRKEKKKIEDNNNHLHSSLSSSGSFPFSPVLSKQKVNCTIYGSEKRACTTDKRD
jgi:hypothetical protein